jgi:bifunctional polynucleotide phosphatase/kinase
MPADTPIRIIAALGKDQYRKPMTGMFDLVRNLYREKGYEVDMEKSVYVGDAAGRLAGPGRRRDHGDTDYKLALNAGLKFLTPEVSFCFLPVCLLSGADDKEHFLGLPRPEFPEPPNGFHPSKINLNRE